MLVLRYRLAVAGVITAGAIAGPAAALASGSGSPSGKPAPPQASAASAKRSEAQSQLQALAASAGISVNRLQAGLVAAKRADGNTAAGIAAFAASTGVSLATAQRIVHAVSGTQVDRGMTGGPAAAAALASRLGVSTSTAGRAF